MGAFHAANFTLRRGDVFPQAVCLSGNYDMSSLYGWGEQGDAFYFQNPTAYVSGLHGDHLQWLRGQVRLVLVVGQGMWEDTTGAEASTRRIAGLLAGEGHPARAGRVGARRGARLAVVAAPARAPPAPDDLSDDGGGP